MPSTLLASLTRIDAWIYVIALSARRGSIVSHLRSLKIDKRSEVLPAFDKRRVDFDTVTEMVSNGTVGKSYFKRAASERAAWYRRPSQGRLACALSHLTAMRTFVRSRHRVGIVLEDDARISPEWMVSALTMPPPFDVLYLGYCEERCSDQAKWIDRGRHFRWREAVFPLCLHGYAVQRPAARRLLEASLPLEEPIDNTFASIAANLSFRSFIALPPAVRQVRSFTSATHTEVEVLRAGSDTAAKEPRPFKSRLPGKQFGKHMTCTCKGQTGACAPYDSMAERF